MRRFLLALLVSVVLAGCGAVDVTMTREIAAATPTLVVSTLTPFPALTTLPSHTPTFTLPPTSTPAPQTTPSPSLTRPPTRTPRPTATPEGQMRATLSDPILSRQGQLAYVANEILWLETAPGSGNFVALDGYVTGVHWSEDGSKLLFGWNSKPYPVDGGYGPGFPEDYRLYSVASGEIWSLKEKIPGFLALPSEIEICSHHEYVNDWASSFMNWSPDGSKIMFRLRPNGSLEELLTLVDLHTQIYTVLLTCSDYLESVPFITDNVFVTRYHCGSPCQTLEGYNYQGNLVWNLPWVVSSQVTLANDGRSIVSLGRLMSDEPQPQVIDFIDMDTGVVTPITPLLDEPMVAYFHPFFEPALSPDGNFIGFYYGGEGSGKPFMLYIVDQEGFLIGGSPYSWIVDWRLNGGPVINQLIDGTNQLLYLPLDNAAATPITALVPLQFPEGRWSPDGRFFIYTALDEAKKMASIYLWQPGDVEPTLIHSVASLGHYQDFGFSWMPDSSRVYFNPGWAELWVYEVATGEVRLLAAAEPWFVSQ